jgi:hypothetical protein
MFVAVSYNTTDSLSCCAAPAAGTGAGAVE